MLGHVPAGLRRPVSRGFLDELQPQARVRDDVHLQLGRPVREQRLAAKLAAELRVNVNDLHAAGVSFEPESGAVTVNFNWNLSLSQRLD